MIRVVRVMGVIHGDDVGQDRRPHIIVVIGRNAHKLRAFDQKRGVANEGDPHLVSVECGNIESCRNDAPPVARDQSGTILRCLQR
jgi:hypothetical protein